MLYENANYTWIYFTVFYVIFLLCVGLHFCVFLSAVLYKYNSITNEDKVNVENTDNQLTLHITVPYHHAFVV